MTKIEHIIIWNNSCVLKRRTREEDIGELSCHHNLPLNDPYRSPDTGIININASNPLPEKTIDKLLTRAVGVRPM